MSNERIKWVDLAKGVAIILVILGHGSWNTTVDIFIYSFHMPLLFILSGVTFKEKSGWISVKRDVCRLIIPYAVINIVMFFGTGGGFFSFIHSLIWGNSNDGIILGYEFTGVTLTWFCIALFWGRFFYRICIKINDKYRMLFILVLSITGMYISKVVTLPQYLDGVPVV